LTAVSDVQKERAKEYEQEGGENSFERIATIFNAYRGLNLLPSDVALILRILKEVRSEYSDKVHLDSFIDGVSYESIRAKLRIAEKSNGISE
ncbi:MAG: DUF6378 domain-containing protein, partial [Bacillati bacterium]